MKRLLFILVLLVLVTACAKEKIPVIVVTEPAPAPKKMPPPEPVVEPMPEPEPIPDADIALPEPVPDVVQEPEPVLSGRASCTLVGLTGEIYTPADISAGLISAEDFNNLRKCYPYFFKEQTDTQAMCCVI